MNNIVFLIIDYVPHQINSIEKIIKTTNYKIYSFSISVKHPYIPSNIENLFTLLLKDYTRNQLLSKIKNIRPIMIVTAGWMVPKYTWVCKRIKKRTNIPIVAMSDTQWYGTWKQKVNTFISPFHVGKSFTHIWVAGLRQYEYARRLGFKNDTIIYNSLCGNSHLFSKVNICNKKHNYPKNFLYIGRLESEKGLRNLLDAWTQIENKSNWTFTLVGDGNMKEELLKSDQFILKGIKTQEELVNEFQDSGCFVLPSLHEQWSLVIHEAAIAGLPLLCTETCGAVPHFLINQFNGFKIKNNSIEDLKEKLVTIINHTTEELVVMGLNSRKLSYRITPEIHRSSLLQLIS